jgi:hypothetical protein
MIYLMDVDALVSLIFKEHALHERVANWLTTLSARDNVLASSPITEIGVVRILSLPVAANLSIQEAQAALARVKSHSTIPFIFVPDELGADQLPAWVVNSRQTTDGHLVALAKAHGALLATLDRKIRGAFLIPA